MYFKLYVVLYDGVHQYVRQLYNQMKFSAKQKFNRIHFPQNSIEQVKFFLESESGKNKKDKHSDESQLPTSG